MAISNLPRQLFMVFSYQIAQFMAAGAIANTTVLPSTTLPPRLPPPILPQNKTNENSGNSVEFRLTKLFDVHLEGESEQLKSYLRSIVYEEVQKTFKVFEAEVKNLSETEKLVQTESSKCNDNGRETLLVLLDNLAKEIQDVRNALKILNSDNSWVKENIISNITLSNFSSKQPTETYFKTKTSVGVYYDPNTLIPAPSDGRTKKNFPKNCKEVQENGYNMSGIYEIRPRNSEKSFPVLCDMETRGGGWTHFQKRYDGSQDFFLNYRDYKFGFGDLEGEFWLGLENIYSLTAFEVNELLVEIVDRDNVKAYAHYKAFGIGAEKEGYPLHVLRGFSGDAGDSLVQHLGSKFSTKDFDQDEHAGNCAQSYSGAWWYKKCHSSNLNGRFINVDIPKQYVHQGMHWLTFRNHEYCHSKSRMLVRPADK